MENTFKNILELAEAWDRDMARAREEAFQFAIQRVCQYMNVSEAEARRLLDLPPITAVSPVTET